MFHVRKEGSSDTCSLHIGNDQGFDMAVKEALMRANATKSDYEVFDDESGCTLYISNIDIPPGEVVRMQAEMDEYVAKAKRKGFFADMSFSAFSLSALFTACMLFQLLFRR
jgi:hypothetical protein